MPSRNIVKVYGEDCYYHVYNRGVGKMVIFRDDNDYRFFLGLLKRYLMPTVQLDRLGRPIANYSSEIELIAYCLMPNHYHLFVYLKDRNGLVHLARGVMTSYSMYFNKKYKRVGKLFQGHFLASRITNDAYFRHVTRYIHLNPMDIGAGDYMNYPYSSIGYFLGDKHAEWLHQEKIVQTSDERQSYREFLQDYEDIHLEINEIKHFLANSIEGEN